MATVKEKMTALADEVREISGSEELMGLDDMQQNLDVANENVQTESDLIEQIQVALENKISVDLSDYATIEYVDEAIAAADVGEDIYVQAEEPTNAEDGTVWIDLDENIEVKAPDTTLSIAGEPADAKAVGDALANKQPAGDYALKSDIPNDYLTEVPAEYVTEAELNAKGYLTSFTETDPTVPAWAKTESKPVYTASEVGADAVGTANSAVSSHNSATNAHSDIRAKIGDLTALNTTAKDNLVAAINEAAASGGADSNIFIVTVDAATMTASHSASEIGEAKIAGKLVYAMISQSGAILQLYSYSEGSESVPNSTKAFFTTSTSVEADNTVVMLYMMVADDKTVTYEARQLTGVPTGGTAGQVLTKGSDGNPVWADATGGAAIPSAKGVEF